MSMIYGKNLKIEIEGASHEKFIRVIISGFPSGVKIDLEKLNAFVARRKAQNNEGATLRHEPDELIIESGIEKGITSGKEIKIKVNNKDVDLSEYAVYDDMPRPSHADYVSHIKYGSAHYGGGIFSGRMTLPLCIAGGICLQYLYSMNIEIRSFISRIGNAVRTGYDFNNPDKFDYLTDVLSEEMKYEICAARIRHDSVGGEIEGIITGLPIGVGEPIFNGLASKLSSLLFCIPAVKGVEFGCGFGFSKLYGSCANDSFNYQNKIVKTSSNYSGGINGGLSNGMPVVAKVAVKPTPSIGIVQNTVSLSKGNNVALEIKGRHDTCIVPRAAVVVEGVMGIVVLDLMIEGGFIYADKTLDNLRDIIDYIDDKIVFAIIERNEIASEIGAIKSSKDLPVSDVVREKEIINRLSNKYNIPDTDIKRLYDVLFDLSKKRQ